MIRTGPPTRCLAAAVERVTSVFFRGARPSGKDENSGTRWSPPMLDHDLSFDSHRTDRSLYPDCFPRLYRQQSGRIYVERFAADHHRQLPPSPTRLVTASRYGYRSPSRKSQSRRQPNMSKLPPGCSHPRTWWRCSCSRRPGVASANSRPRECGISTRRGRRGSSAPQSRRLAAPDG